MTFRKWCRVCARGLTGSRRICERCRTREKRGQEPVQPEARLVPCEHCRSTFAVPFGVAVPETCSAACQARLTAWREAEARRAEELAAREAQRLAQPVQAVSDPEPVYEEQWVMEPVPGAPWSSRSVLRWVRVD